MGEETLEQVVEETTPEQPAVEPVAEPIVENSQSEVEDAQSEEVAIDAIATEGEVNQGGDGITKQ